MYIEVVRLNIILSEGANDAWIAKTTSSINFDNI